MVATQVNELRIFDPIWQVLTDWVGEQHAYLVSGPLLSLADRPLFLEP